MSGLFGLNDCDEAEYGFAGLGFGFLGKKSAAERAAAKEARRLAKAEAKRIKAEAKFRAAQEKIQAKQEAALRKQALKDQKAAAKQALRDQKELAKAGDPGATVDIPTTDQFGNPVGPGETDVYGNPVTPPGGGIVDPFGINPGTLSPGGVPLDFNQGKLLFNQPGPAQIDPLTGQPVYTQGFPSAGSTLPVPGGQINVSQPGYGPPTFGPQVNPYGQPYPGQPAFGPPGSSPVQLPYNPAQYNPYAGGAASQQSQQGQIAASFPQYAPGGGGGGYAPPMPMMQPSFDSGGGGYDAGGGYDSGGGEQQQQSGGGDPSMQMNYDDGSGESGGGGFFGMGTLAADAAPKSIVDQLREGRDLGLETWNKINEQIRISQGKPVQVPIQIGPMPEDNVGKGLVVAGLALLGGTLLFKYMNKGKGRR